MTKIYKEHKDLNGNLVGILVYFDNKEGCIPINPDNTDYQQFLKYQAEGGKVYGADEEVPDA